MALIVVEYASDSLGFEYHGVITGDGETYVTTGAAT